MLKRDKTPHGLFIPVTRLARQEDAARKPKALVARRSSLWFVVVDAIRSSSYSVASNHRERQIKEDWLAIEVLVFANAVLSGCIDLGGIKVGLYPMEESVHSSY